MSDDTSPTVAWSSRDLQLIDAAGELEIAALRADGSLRRWTPIWVVRVGEQVYVRSWHRRETGWFGQVVRSGRARLRVPGLEVEATVEDVGEGALREAVDEAYRAKYRRYGDAAVGPMVTDAAAATTLLLKVAGQGGDHHRRGDEVQPDQGGHGGGVRP